jgi:hypothetical protein
MTLSEINKTVHDGCEFIKTQPKEKDNGNIALYIVSNMVGEIVAWVCMIGVDECGFKDCPFRVWHSNE